ncbi:hypothetical protein D3C86_1999860 [compost metagenome]
MAGIAMPTATFISTITVSISASGMAGMRHASASSSAAMAAPTASPPSSGRRRPVRAEMRPDEKFPIVNAAIIGSSV